MLLRVIGGPLDLRRLQERSLRVDAVLRMTTPPAHLSGRTLLPGALLAVLVTCAGLFALAVVIAVGPDGPVRLWLDGGGSSTNLRPGAGGTGALPSGPASLLPGGSISGRTGEVTLASPVARTDRPGAVRLRANTRVQRRSARTPAKTRPNGTAPAATPSPLVSQPTAGSTPAAVAPAAPGSTVKSRSRPTSPTTTEVPKQRVAAGSTPAPTSATASPEARSAPAPAPEPQRVQPVAPQDTGVGVTDGVLDRVPTP
jgi:hypothetical protein